MATITMDNPAGSSATPPPHPPLPQPTPELNNPLALDSPGVCWGSIQSPEKAFLSALNHDALKTPARRIAPLPLRIPFLSHPDADSDVEARTHTIQGSSHEGTPETDTLPFDEPPSALAERIMRAQDNPSPPPIPRDFDIKAEDRSSSPGATMDEMFPPIDALLKTPLPPDSRHLSPELTPRTPALARTVDTPIASITPAVLETRKTLQDDAEHTTSALAPELIVTVPEVVAVEESRAPVLEASAPLSSTSLDSQLPTTAQEGLVSPLSEPTPTRYLTPQRQTILRDRDVTPTLSSPRRRSPRLSPQPSSAAASFSPLDRQPSTAEVEGWSTVSDSEDESSRRSRPSPGPSSQPVFSNAKPEKRVLPAQTDNSSEAESFKAPSMRAVAIPIRPLKIRKHGPPEPRPIVNSDQPDIFSPVSAEDDEKEVAVQLSLPSSEDTGRSSREPGPQTPQRVHNPDKTHFPVGAPSRARTDLLMASKMPVGTASLNDPMRSPQRVPVSGPKAASSGMMGAGRGWQGIPRTPIRATADDPIRTPRRVPIATTGVTDAARSTRRSPTRSSSPRKEPTSTKPHGQTKAKAGSEEPGVSPPELSHVTNLPFPLSSTTLPIAQAKPSHPDEPATQKSAEKSAIPVPNRPKSLLRQPTASTSRIPRSSAKPYARPASKDSKVPVLNRDPSSHHLLKRSTTAFNRAPKPRDEILKKVADERATTPPSSKRKRDIDSAAPSPSPRRMQAVVLIERRPSSSPLSSPGGPSAAVGAQLSTGGTGKETNAPPSSQLSDAESDATPLHEGFPADGRPASKIRRTSRSPRLRDGVDVPENRPSVPVNGGASAHVNNRQKVLSGRNHNRSDPFMMSALALRTLTTTNTTKNQEYAVAQIQTRVVRREGKRPESPATKIKTIQQKQKDGQDRDREERAARRARRSDGEAEDFQESENTDPTELVSTDSPPRHRLGAGEDEEYVTPERPKDESKVSDINAVPPRKKVKWDHGLFTTVYLDEIQLGQDRPRDRNARKSCLATPIKTLQLDSLGNVRNAGVPLPDLAQEDVEVLKVVYDDDPPPEPETDSDPAPALPKPKLRSRKKIKA